MSDQTINCIDCKNDFQFTEGEAQFYADRRLKKPRRCKDCRKARKNNGGGRPPAPAPHADEFSDMGV